MLWAVEDYFALCCKGVDMAELCKYIAVKLCAVKSLYWIVKASFGLDWAVL